VFVSKKRSGFTKIVEDEEAIMFFFNPTAASAWGWEVCVSFPLLLDVHPPLASEAES